MTQQDVVITHEDVDRAHDRIRVSEARAQRGLVFRFRLLWLLVGPGILVMLGENDGPSMISYAATGARLADGSQRKYSETVLVPSTPQRVISSLVIANRGDPETTLDGSLSLR